MCGLTAAAFARAGWTGPAAVYEGRFGLYATHLAGRPSRPEAVGEDLGTRWELMRTAVKPYPICHFNHAFADAALLLRAEHGIEPADVRAIRCAIHPVPGKVVCQPAGEQVGAARRVRRQVQPALRGVGGAGARAVHARRAGGRRPRRPRDPRAGAQGRGRRRPRGRCSPTPTPGAWRSSSPTVASSRTASRSTAGHDQRPLTNAEIVEKFTGTIGRVADAATAERVRAAVLSLGDDRPAAEFAEACRG